MNDPGLDDAVAAEANALDHTSSHNEKGDTREIDAHHPHAARWWLASTAYPLAAGTFGPMSSAFSICSLSQPWRMEILPGGGERDITDPKWVTALNAVSLVFALIANVALSLNMARRIRFEVAQPIIIVGWYISSFLLLGILIGLGVLMYEPQNAGHVYTQAYFYGTFAAGLYFIIASLLVVTAWGAHKGHYSREYKLTTSQRTLMLQTIILFIYLLGGSAVYARIEGWKFMDAVYWADYTLLTIGVGNFAPVTHLGRGLLFPYAVGGIVILGLIISSIRTLMLEHGRQKIADLLTARTHKFLVKEAFSERNNRLVPNLRVDENEGSEISDRERQKREFITMRRVRQLATVQHKWISLIASLVVWMALWLIGAAIFWRSEVHIQWTYFEALYFAYTTLLTIGFGDLYPVSSLGKAFFVFWSLLAVPTITILISNISDTLIRFVKDITLFIGEVTILPGDEPLHDRIKDIFHISWRDKWLQESTGEENDSQDILTDMRNGTDRNDFNARRHAVEAEEHKKEESARRRGDIATENVHHYHYLLFREIRKMMELTTKNLSKEFDYLEWEYYLALISGQHNPPYESNTEKAKEDVKRQEKFRDWSWIDKKNPLLGEKSEVEWLLNALTEALERELKMASRDYHSPDVSDEVDSSAVVSGDGGDEGLESGNAREE
ncbi:putative ion channel [Penicillium brasilianum]|uniref:Putative ion channel n=1 Tax=Penicillium brasilianum TaxID=104259 RepID=A0A1S9RHS1_PENBI|nr:putative ion channel [Penicillium brasilianum]